jgi:hypothetical protein
MAGFKEYGCFTLASCISYNVFLFTIGSAMQPCIMEKLSKTHAFSLSQVYRFFYSTSIAVLRFELVFYTSDDVGELQIQ